MSRIHEIKISGRCRWTVLASVLATALISPADQAAAFFQQTKLEGSLGSDIGGVWLSVSQIMPEFRVSFPNKELASGVPFSVGPIPADLEPVTGKNPAGVSITGCTNAGFCGEYGIIAGDIVIKVNQADITDTASFAKAMESPPSSVLLSIRRPELKMTTARLLKVRYQNTGKETPEGSEANETLDIRVLDVKLPFAEEIEKTRQAHTFFQPTAAQIEDLGKNWLEVPDNSPLLLINGQHRFVAKASFDEALAADPTLINSKFAIVMSMDGNPIQSRGGKVIDIYGIETMDSKSMEGNYVTATLASAPFPINIEFKGRFRMTRIADWSDEDDKRRAARKKPKEDLDKYKTLPDVPPPAKPDAKAN